jgi:predicted anti-sigma-YlaC factor YlaD
MLKLAHRILIMSAIALGVLLVAFAGFRYLVQDDPSLNRAAVIGGAAALVLSTYLRWFLRKDRPQPPR